MGSLRYILALLTLPVAAAVAFSNSSPDDLRAAFDAFTAGTMARVLALSLVAVFLAVARLRVFASVWGHDLHFRQAAYAFVLGTFAGALLMQLVGQAVARSAWLARCGVPVSASIKMFAGEKIIAALIAGGYALAGVMWLFREQLAAEISEPSGLSALVTLALIAAMLACEQAPRALPYLPPFPARLLLAAALTTAIHGLTLIAWIVAFSEISNAAGIDLAACAALIMFGGSVPIGVAGWGPRELMAVSVMAWAGAPAVAALGASVLMGLISLAAVTLYGGVTILCQLLPHTLPLKVLRAVVRGGISANLLKRLVPHG